MPRDTYIPLFSTTLDSSLWSLEGNCLKVFLTLALKADPDGFVVASVDGLARAAALPLEEVTRHLRTLEGPDEHSKDLSRQPDNEGRRIERVDRGWRIINMAWYREEARRQSELARKRRWWTDKGSPARRGARRTEIETETETQIEIQTRERDPERGRAHDSPDGVFDAESERVNPKRGTFVPDDWEPSDLHRVRCQELRMDLAAEVKAFRHHEFNRPYSDWARRFSKWLEDSRLRREAAVRAGKAPKPARKAEDVLREEKWR